MIGKITAANDHRRRLYQRRLQMLAPYLLSVMRIMIGLMLLEYGTMKLFEFPGPVSTEKLPPLLLASAYLEFFGGLFLTLGIATRLIAFIISGEMAFAYFLWHLPKNMWPGLNGGDLAITWCFGLLYIAAAGGGPLEITKSFTSRSTS